MTSVFLSFNFLAVGCDVYLPAYGTCHNHSYYLPVDI